MTEKNSNKLIASIQPVLHADTFVFCSVTSNIYESLDIQPHSVFREDEGVSLILQKEVADKFSLKYSTCWSLITCRVNSDLSAVGFIAAISQKLAQAAIPVNPVSAYFHDHLFVPKEKAHETMRLLTELSLAFSA